jgi:hypothetical protein
MSRPSVLVLGVVLSGCAVSLGTIGLVSLDPESIGLKLLRPGATGRSCRASILGVPLRAGDPEVREAVAGILALDGEGNVVVNAQIQWRPLLTGIYNRRCVEVRGDLARTVSSVILPAPPGHQHHAPP